VLVVDRSPTAAVGALFAEDYERLLDRLGDAELRSIALWALEGYTNAQIAVKLGKVESTVERKLKRIRSLWNEEVTT
jgi:DNA-directed RNA polymerase specialized sigma24 family protein